MAKKLARKKSRRKKKVTVKPKKLYRDIKDVEGLKSKRDLSDVHPAPIRAKESASIRSKPIGKTGVNMSGGLIYESRLRNFQGTQRNVVIQEMRTTDSLIYAVLSAFTLLGSSAPKTIEPGGPETVDDDAAEFVDGLFDDMSLSWPETLSSIYTFIPFGFSPLEINFKMRFGERETGREAERMRLSSMFDDGRIGWSSLAHRAQDTISKWEVDEDSGDILGFRQQVSNSGTETEVIPIEKMLLFRTSAEKNNPQGWSLLEPAYRDWFMKRHFEEMEGIGVKRDLTGMVRMKVPKEMNIWSAANVTQRNEHEEFVARIERDEMEGIVIPDDYDVDLIKSGGQRQVDMDKLVARKNLMIAFTALADFLLVGHEKIGSFALSTNKVKLFMMALRGYQVMIENQVNRKAIPQIIRLNNIPVTLPPKIRMGVVEELQVLEVIEALEKLAGVGAQIFPNDPLLRSLFDRLGLPEPEEDALELEPRIPVDTTKAEDIDEPEEIEE